MNEFKSDHETNESSRPHHCRNKESYDKILLNITLLNKEEFDEYNYSQYTAAIGRWCHQLNRLDTISVMCTPSVLEPISIPNELYTFCLKVNYSVIWHRDKA